LIGPVLLSVMTIGLSAGCSDVAESPIAPEPEPSETMVASLDAGDLPKRLGGYGDPDVERYKGAVPFNYIQALGENRARCIIGNNSDYNGLPFEQAGADFDWNVDPAGRPLR